MPLRREIAPLDRAATGPRRSSTSARGRPAHRARHRRLARGPAAQRRLRGLRRALSRGGIQVLHITGLGKEFEPELPDGGAPYRVVPYADRMELPTPRPTSSWPGRVPTRCELTAVGLPAVYVPLPIGNGEQRLNAADVVAAGGGILVEDAALTPEWVTGRTCSRSPPTTSGWLA